MTGLSVRRLPAGHARFARYAYPPNELGYCGPDNAEVLLRGDNPAGIAAHARQFDGSWPYLRVLAAAAGVSDPMEDEVVRSYWVGGRLLDRVDPAALLEQLRGAFTGQVTGLLDALSTSTGVLAHHSFHVLAVYPWVRFLDRDTPTALGVLQNCRIRWGSVESVDGEQVRLASRPLLFDGGVLTLGECAAEQVRWSRDGVSLTAAPAPGDTVAAHWDWVCDSLDDSGAAALESATRTTLDLVNRIRSGASVSGDISGGIGTTQEGVRP